MIRVPKFWRGMCAAGLVLFALQGPAQAWWPEGHAIVTRAAVRSLGDDMPGFFRDGEAMIAHAVKDPDIIKNRAVPQLNATEGPDHYLDLELLQGRDLPPTRGEFVALCQELEANPKYVGFLAYSVAEWTQRLAVAFAEHRKWPDNPYVQSKALVYAGILAHYANDAGQPLHLTIHFDGRVPEGGRPPHNGIHEKVDGLIQGHDLTEEDLASDTPPAACEDLMAGIMATVDESRTHIDAVYELEAALLSDEDPSEEDAAAIRALALDRGKASALFTAVVFETAWAISESVSLPSWIDRSSD
ncbi:hypothetical protein HN371_25705 [Candidatus Poribacteria bacterium]|jgi:hypothetical protein|nr:hypothetical protein [Candidatus Poribacteria bacterium]MBT5533128.1 hypothetical protein [Candidatus Poribacteria bacterium]MBT7100089.1 hypothetical protein [Candidatus Poribacteria bacterium]MBT7806429.1 hypothetical protein [Candidatus Poribacteria bacterium]